MLPILKVCKGEEEEEEGQVEGEEDSHHVKEEEEGKEEEMKKITQSLHASDCQGSCRNAFVSIPCALDEEAIPSCLCAGFSFLSSPLSFLSLR